MRSLFWAHLWFSKLPWYFHEKLSFVRFFCIFLENSLVQQLASSGAQTDTLNCVYGCPTVENSHFLSSSAVTNHPLFEEALPTFRAAADGRMMHSSPTFLLKSVLCHQLELPSEKNVLHQRSFEVLLNLRTNDTTFLRYQGFVLQSSKRGLLIRHFP